MLLMLACLALYGVEISPQVKHHILLPDTQIYLDRTHTATIETISDKPFRPVMQESIGFGYSPDLDVWVKISLYNPTDKPLQRILEYAHPLVAQIELYDARQHTIIGKDGLLQNVNHRQTLNPYFILDLQPKEHKTYYLKASSSMIALVLRLELWEPRVFYSHALQLRSWLSLFFGAMFIIILYNLIIYFIVREISYLYYVLFFASVALHQFNYRGVLAFTLSPDTILLLMEYATFVVAAPVFFLMLFTKEVLQLKGCKKVDRFMTTLLLLYPSAIVLVYLLGLDRLRAVLSVSVLFALFAITAYALYRKNRQAKYLTLGWALFWTAGLLMYLSNMGIYDIFAAFPFYTEMTLVAEALIFAFSLAMMIKQTNRDKLEAQQKYIILQAEKELELVEQVEVRTRQLTQSLQEKDILLKELNHRVKNSIQTIVSFLRLQVDEIEDDKMRTALTQIENRILSINHLYALLNTKENLNHVDAHAYFDLLATTIQKSFRKSTIEIKINTTVRLHSQTAIYCGFIINEALTNALQHAFEEGQKGEIEILLLEETQKAYKMQIKDNGRGFDSARTFTSLGLTILESLATLQLKGTLQIESTEGTTITIKWGGKKDE
jgi:two-component sensor histidine kinase